MNKEMEEIALRVAKPFINEPYQGFPYIRQENIALFAEALLAELAKVSEPVVSEDVLKDMACSEFESAMSFGVSRDNFMRLARSVAQRATPLPQPDLVAEIERLKSRLEFDDGHGWDGISCRDETIKGQDKTITELRQQLSAARADNEQMLTLLQRASDSLGAFTSDEGWSQQDMDTMDSIDSALATGDGK